MRRPRCPVRRHSTVWSDGTYSTGRRQRYKSMPESGEKRRVFTEPCRGSGRWPATRTHEPHAHLMQLDRMGLDDVNTYSRDIRTALLERGAYGEARGVIRDRRGLPSLWR